MRLPLPPRTLRARLLGPLTGLALVVGSALLLATFVSNAAAYRGDGPRYRSGPGYGHSRAYGGPYWSSGPRRYRGYYPGPRFRVFAPIRHYYRPRFSFSLGLGFGQPYYYHPPVVVERDHYIYRDRDDTYRDDDDTRRESAPSRDDNIDRGRPAPSEEDFDVTNEPPPGCYYHDGFCDRDFSTLDDYTEHLKHQRHSQTIDIIEKRSGDRLHTLEFVHGEWQPQINE